ncbi:hypothetical protein GGI43DRAFT_429201 [Trichoderma evansii]
MENLETPPLTTKSESKVRILLESVTYLVPGSDCDEKLSFIKNIHMYPYGDFFGLKNRNCFFLIDHHGHDRTVQEEKVSVIWYKWTGESLVHINDTFPLWIQEEKFYRLPKGPDGKYEPKVQREIIRSWLNLGIPISAERIEFLRENPEHALWLKAHLHRELWAQIEPLCELPEEEE